MGPVSSDPFLAECWLTFWLKATSPDTQEAPDSVKARTPAVDVGFDAVDCHVHRGATVQTLQLPRVGADCASAGGHTSGTHHGCDTMTSTLDPGPVRTPPEWVFGRLRRATRSPPLALCRRLSEVGCPSPLGSIGLVHNRWLATGRDLSESSGSERGDSARRTRARPHRSRTRVRGASRTHQPGTETGGDTDAPCAPPGPRQSLLSLAHPKQPRGPVGCSV